MASITRVRDSSGHPSTTSLYKLRIEAADLAGGSGEVDLGVALPTSGVLLRRFGRTVTPEATGATKTLDVGILTGETNEDPDGFVDGADVSAAAEHLAGGALAQTGILCVGQGLSCTPGSDDDFAELVFDLYLEVFEYRDDDQ